MQVLLKNCRMCCRGIAGKLCALNVWIFPFWPVRQTSQGELSTSDDISIISRACLCWSGFGRGSCSCCMFERLSWFDLMARVSCTLESTLGLVWVCEARSFDAMPCYDDEGLSYLFIMHTILQTSLCMSLSRRLLQSHAPSSMCELTPHLWCWNINAESWSCHFDLWAPGTLSYILLAFGSDTG